MHSTTLPLLLLSLSLAHAQLSVRELGSMYMRQPGFSSIYEHSEYLDATERFSLIISCFSAVPGTRDDVNLMRYIGKSLGDPAQTPIETLGSDYIWPREPNQIPTEVFGFEDAVSVPSGFLVAGKNDGAVDLADLRDPSNVVSTDITRASNDEPENIWFYHRVIWKDADGDGQMDAFTCRCRQELFPETYYSSFMWLKNPGGDDPIQTAPWDIGLRISDDDCDTFTREARLPAGTDGDYDAIFTIGYFMNKFSVYWSEHPDGLWNDASLISSRLIDTVVDDAACSEPGEYFCGHFFDVDIADMNQDGRLDLLVSINSEVWGSLAIYEIPDDFRTGEYTVHKIADGFIPTSGMQGGGSPGQPQAFYPTDDTSGKPWILLSGDDDGRTYYLYPLSQDPNDWSYEMTYFVDQGARNIVGKPSAFDSDGDGYKEVFVPCYSADEVKFFTFAP